jgi:hypothetical protein
MSGASLLKGLLLVAGNLVACGLLGLVATFATMALSQGKGGGATGNIMMWALGVLGLVFLLSLPVVSGLLRHWGWSLPLAIAMGLACAVALAVMWVGLAFSMMVILNR